MNQWVHQLGSPRTGETFLDRSQEAQPSKTERDSAKLYSSHGHLPSHGMVHHVDLPRREYNVTSFL